jgi:hypothetical protein
VSAGLFDVTLIESTTGVASASTKKSAVSFPGENMSGYLMLNFRCKNVAQWRKGYAMDLSDRTAAGLTELFVLADVADPNKITLLFKSSDFDKTKALLGSPKLHKHIEENCGGMDGPVEAKFMVAG